MKMNEDKDELTFEEKRLVGCLRGQLDQLKPTAVSLEKKTEAAEQQPEPPADRVKQSDKEEILTIETVLQDLKKQIGRELDEVRQQTEALSVDALLEAEGTVENLQKKIAGLHELVGVCIEKQKLLNARQAVAELLAGGMSFRRIQIDDLCFSVDADNEIRLCSGSRNQ